MSGREGGRLLLSLLDEAGTFRSGMRVRLRVEEGRVWVGEGGSGKVGWGVRLCCTAAAGA
jgi:hypothetical protein